MSTALGHVRQVKKLLASQTCIVEVEFPVEAYKDLVAAFDDADVGIAPVAKTAGPPMPYGVYEDHAQGAGEQEQAPSPPAAPRAEGARKWEELPPAQQAGILCGDPDFWRYMGAENEEECTAEVRERFGVASRAELNQEPQASVWRNTAEDFRVWLRYRDFPEAAA